MKSIGQFIRVWRVTLISAVIALAGLVGILTYRLASLTAGVSALERATVAMTVGWHGIYNRPFFLPLLAVRSIFFKLFNSHDSTVLRLPNVIIGIVAVIAFFWLMYKWYGRRTALLSGVLFATSAWVLHISRLASFDVMYLSVLPVVLLLQYWLQRHFRHPAVLYGSLAVYGILLYIPGIVWIVLLSAYWQRKALAAGWRHFSSYWQRLAYIGAFGIWLPVLINYLIKTGSLTAWLGLPHHLAPPLTLLKQATAVFVHAFIRGPEYPQLWLGRAPVLDIFALVACLAGIYFYATHPKAVRSRILSSFSLVSIVLIALNGPVGFSLLVPLLYIFTATGLAYLLRDWLRTFPVNPLARSFGIGLVVVAIGLSCAYNLRSYFVVWPHNRTQQATFHYRL